MTEAHCFDATGYVNWNQFKILLVIMGRYIDRNGDSEILR